jgi:hypothetical protein
VISIINAQPSALSSKTLHSQHTRALPTRSRQPHRCFDHQPVTVRRFVPCRGHYKDGTWVAVGCDATLVVVWSLCSSRSCLWRSGVTVALWAGWCLAIGLT